MPTVLDSFVIELGLDPSKFTEGQKTLMQQLQQMLEGTKKGGDAVEEMSKKMLNLFSILRREALVAFGGFFGGSALLEMVDHFARLETSAQRFGRSIGLSAQQTLAWANAFRAIGADPKAGLGALAQMEAQLGQMAITGQAPMMGLWGRLGVDPRGPGGQMKTSDQMWIDIAAALQRQVPNPRYQRAWLQRFGASEEMINFLALGPDKIKKLVEEHAKLIPNIDKEVEKLNRYQEQVAALDTAWEKLGMTITNLLAGPLGSLMSGLTFLLGGKESFKQQGWQGIDMWEWLKSGKITSTGPAPPEARAPASVNDKVAMIRQIFSAQGIDPDIAVRVAQSEGLYNPLGDIDPKTGMATSFGDFQLHYSPKHDALGDIFTRETGLDARDPATSKQQYEFIAKWVAKHGWGDFHGWKGAPFAGVGRKMGGDVHIQNNNNVTINDRSGSPGKTAGVAVEHMNRQNVALGIGPYSSAA